MRRPSDAYLLSGPDGLEPILAKLKHGPLALDTETTGLNWRTDRVGSINLAAGTTAIVAVKGALGPVVRYVSDQIKARRDFVFHHAKFDMHMMRETFGVHFPYPCFDTQIESRLIDQRGVGWGKAAGHHLKQLAKEYVDPDALDPEKDLMAAIKAAGGKTKGDWMLAPRRKFGKYSVLDPWYTLRLHQIFIEMINGWVNPPGIPSLRSLYENERWLTLALRDMEARGIKVRERFLRKWRDGLGVDRTRKLRTLSRLLGYDINWNSVPQVREALFTGKRGLRLQPTHYSGKTKLPSAEKNALIRMQHPIGAALLQYRKVNHAYTSDAGAALKAITPNGLIHCDFNQNVDTGRTSCRAPNLQGQDRKSGIRDAFVPRKKLTFRMFDFSQAEMRFAAHIAQEPMMIKGFNNDPNFDVHYATAQKMFGRKKPDDEMRGHAKTMNFAMLYGAGIDNVTEGLMNRMSRRDAIHACQLLGYVLHLAENPFRVLATLLKERYKESMPQMGVTAKQKERIAAGTGLVYNQYGRHRWLESDEAYKAFNSDIQGSAGDCAKFALVNVYKECQVRDGSLALLLLIHDELVTETDGDPVTDKRVLELMADTRTFSVPIVADMKGSDISWQQKTSIAS